MTVSEADLGGVVLVPESIVMNDDKELTMYTIEKWD